MCTPRRTTYFNQIDHIHIELCAAVIIGFKSKHLKIYITSGNESDL